VSHYRKIIFTDYQPVEYVKPQLSGNDKGAFSNAFTKTKKSHSLHYPAAQRHINRYRVLWVVGEKYCKKLRGSGWSCIVGRWVIHCN
jgi:hypothetical protein